MSSASSLVFGDSARQCGNSNKAIGYSQLDRLVPRHRDALVQGAQRVTIRVPGREEPLHGVLALCTIPRVFVTPAGAAGQVYSIAIPEDDLSQVLAGKTVVLAERYQINPQLEGNTWLLWVSREPLP